jgi:DNA polymerase elongation subunit (family B)
MALMVKSGGSFKPVNPEFVLFLDVETVPIYKDFESLPEVFKPLWIDKSRKYSYETLPPEELYFEKAGIHAEFGKIVCISVGILKTNPDTKRLNLRIKSYYGHDEKTVLNDFKALLDGHYNDIFKHFFCAHNGIEFDYPYIARRMMIHGIALPALLDVSGSKSWDNRWLLDTMDLWRFGDYKEKTSLNLLAACFGIPSPKDDISGKDVAKVYHHENNLERIMIYCQKDIVTLTRLFLRFAGQTGVENDGDIVYL